MSRISLRAAAVLAMLAAGTLGHQPARADKPAMHAPEAQDFVHGSPDDPSDAWAIAAGGRIYDSWWDALDRPAPTETHPSYPATGKVSGKNSWRCKECHGWDYKGRNGRYATGSHATGIPGIDGAAGRDPQAIAKLLRAPLHGYTSEMISDVQLMNVAKFVSRGQHDIADVIDATSGKPKGDTERGKALFQTICAACHGFDGRLLNWGSADAPAYIGTEASKLPDEVFHKIRSSHPGAAMVNLRALPLKDAIDVLTYAATLPVK
ncbi:MAG: c-type cytochrome [Hyphomicrobiaceae bacterium]|nr:c-type cytochrome [Hyphomicrobiaceae bacterium]